MPCGEYGISGNETIGAGNLRPIAPVAARSQFFAQCDGDETIIAMTGGTPLSLKRPKNAGHCALSLTCHDQNDAEIAGTKVILKRGQSILAYTSTTSTYKIKMKCDDVNQNPNPSCILEFDD